MLSKLAIKSNLYFFLLFFISTFELASWFGQDFIFFSLFQERAFAKRVLGKKLNSPPLIATFYSFKLIVGFVKACKA